MAKANAGGGGVGGGEFIPMTDLNQTAGPATCAGRFLAKRGHVVMKQFHEIGKLKCDCGKRLTFTTLIFSIAQGANGDRTFGLKIEHEDERKNHAHCLVYYDELKELLLAIKYLIELASQTATKHADYTEFVYVTRDDLRVGFYQDTSRKQQVFFGVVPGVTSVYLSFDQLRIVFGLIKKGREYLLEKGADSDAEIMQSGA